MSGPITSASPKPGKAAPSGPVTIKLRNPITFGSQRIESITVQPLKAKHLRRVETDPSANTLKFMVELCSQLSGEVEEVIDELEGEDLADVLAAVARFFSGFKRIGATLSP